ncbi:hypothetical protein [Psychrobacillus sp. FSL K6-1464]|uniref:hypothetical protein n=1 Tax=Psychrobacillus sp. FSL K6-1464 TaxID=2921545 RepID=UPI0030FBDF05
MAITSSEKLGLRFTYSTTNIEEAVQTLEVGFGFEGDEWEQMKTKKSMESLMDFLNAEGMEYDKFFLRNN